MSGEQHYTQDLPYDMEPQDTAGLLLEVNTPAVPGDYSLEFDLKQEGVGWFADHGSEPSRWSVRGVPEASDLPSLKVAPKPGNFR